jgi:hypothetical protein
MNYMTFITSTAPRSLAKSYIKTGDKVEKRAVAHVTEGTAVQVEISTAKKLVEILTQATERDNVAICPGIFQGAETGKRFRMVSEGELARITGSKVGSVKGGLHSVGDEHVAARIKRGIAPSSWLLLDADNPPGMPDELAAMSIAERLAYIEPIIPGITACERVELRGSSARVVNGSGSHKATHAWIQVSDPNKIALLKAHVGVQMVVKGLSFRFEKHSRANPEQVVGIESRTVFDLAVWDTGRLVFCSRPQLVSMDDYSVDDAGICIVNEGAGPLDIGWLQAPTTSDIQSYKKMTGVHLDIDSKALHVRNTGQLTMDTEITSKGVSKSLADWVDGLSVGSKLRCESPFRESQSEAAFIRIGDDGIPFVHDIGNGVTYYMVPKHPMTVAIERSLAPCIGIKYLKIDDNVVSSYANSIYFNPTRRSYFLLNGNELVESKPDTLMAFARLALGEFIDQQLFEKGIAAAAFSKGSEAKQEKESARIRGLLGKSVREWLEFYNQRTDSEISVDIFADRPSIQIMRDRVCIALTHDSFKHGEPDPAIIADFEEHFDGFDSFLSWVAACRFAANRKTAFMWLKTPSNFGKTFISNVLKSLDLVVEMSPQEIESVFEGKASPRRSKDFTSAWIILFEEFKSAKAELKQLEQTMMLNPKYSPSVRVPLYAKLFLSAEDVSSLAGDDLGAENQFANRFSYIPKEGNLTSRPMFERSTNAYFTALRDYIAKYLNEEVEAYRELGRTGASDRADKLLQTFHENNGLGTHFGTLEGSMAEFCEAFTDFVFDIGKTPIEKLPPDQREIASRIHVKDGFTFLVNPRKAMATYIKSEYTVSEGGRLFPKIGKFIRDYFDGVKPFWIDGKTRKAILFQREISEH